MFWTLFFLCYLFLFIMINNICLLVLNPMLNLIPSKINFIKTYLMYTHVKFWIFGGATYRLMFWTTPNGLSNKHIYLIMFAFYLVKKKSFSRTITCQFSKVLIYAQLTSTIGLQRQIWYTCYSTLSCFDNWAASLQDMKSNFFLSFFL